MHRSSGASQAGSRVAWPLLLAAGATCAVAAGSLGVRAIAGQVATVSPAAGPEAVADALAVAVAALGAAVATWYAATAAAVGACMAARTAGAHWRRLESLVLRSGAPLLRGALAGSAGLALSAALAGTAAAGAGVAPGLPDELGWAPGTAAAPQQGSGATDAPTKPAEEAPAHGTHVVRPGESLWSIARDALLERALEPSDRAVAAHWPRWYQANRSAVGPDPNLIHPGQHLVAPNEGDQP